LHPRSVSTTDQAVEKAHLLRCARIASLQRTPKVRLRSSIVARRN
jgi:hypothetical protein